MAKFFIDRPIFAIALSLIIVFAGIIAGFSLPIAQYPNITRPQIEVETNYVGANATTVEESIAQAIEQKVNGVENMRDMRSTSTNTGRCWASSPSRGASPSSNTAVRCQPTDWGLLTMEDLSTWCS